MTENIEPEEPNNDPTDPYGKPPLTWNELQDVLNALGEEDAETAAAIYNASLNAFCERYAESRLFQMVTGQAVTIQIMYFGFYWRVVDFHGLSITLARLEGGATGFCENNKWGYPQKHLSESEATALRGLIEDAFKVEADNNDETMLTALQAIADFMNNVEIEALGYPYDNG